MPDPGSGLRASDEQREQAAQEIREHYAAGRITDDELDQRVQAVYEAQTEDQLQRLRADLPALPPTPQQARAELARRRGELQRRLIQQTGGGVAVFAVCTVIWFAAGATGMFWPIWIALVTLIPLIRNGWRLYGPAPELERVEQELAARERGSRPGGERHELRSAARDQRRADRDRRRSDRQLGRGPDS
jgi:hypothetical protein